MLRGVLTGHHRDLRAAAKLAVVPVDGTGQEAHAPQPDEGAKPPTRREQRSAVIKAARHARFEEVVALDARGWSQTRIAQTLGLDRKRGRVVVADASEIDATEQSFVTALLSRSPELAQTVALARAFRTMVREQRAGELDEWLLATDGTAMAGFAGGLKRELKTIKGTMNGRGGFDLLRHRALEAA